ncbi:hypothetical protein DAEQUDRAFT_738662 [Daedalea quercina L-15889]|uniref:F-box domain-containing protein n=1 Tax=Daedalea quercina L-15889 TaxID=1314783 RepID=A0A165PUF9_9APHY|nr:hypothetical protein DAEQUDRAFT_738662 [Daedalea quercina L-15889]
MGFITPKKMLRRLARALKPKHNCAPRTSPTHAPTKPTMPSPPELPLDIYELIIDFVWPDRDSLIACALTCRAWHQRSRYNLFYRVALHNLDQLSRYASQLAAEPALGAAARELFVTPYYSQSQLLGTFPFALAGKLPCVERLRLDIRRDFYPYIHPDFHGAFASFASVTTLELRRIQFPTLGDFATLVCALPRVHTLACWMVDWVKKTHDVGALRDRKQCLKLRSLELRDVPWSDAFADWLFTAATVQDLQTICVSGVAAKDVGHVERLLEAAGSSLRSLEIGLAPRPASRAKSKTVSEWEGDVGSYPRLVHNTSLRSLCLCLAQKSEWVPGLLSQANSPALREITVQLPRLPKPTKVKHLRFDALDGILSQPQFAALRRLVVECDAGAAAGVQAEAYEAEIAARLPLACARGIVAVRPRKVSVSMPVPMRAVAKNTTEGKPELWDPY